MRRNFTHSATDGCGQSTRLSLPEVTVVNGQCEINSIDMKFTSTAQNARRKTHFRSAASSGIEVPA